MSEVQPTEDAAKLSDPLSSVQSASEGEPTLRAAAQPSGDAPAQFTESSPEPLKEEELTPAAPSSHMEGDTTAAESQTKPDVPSSGASSEPQPGSDRSTDRVTSEPAADAPPAERSEQTSAAAVESTPAHREPSSDKITVQSLSPTSTETVSVSTSAPASTETVSVSAATPSSTETVSVSAATPSSTETVSVSAAIPSSTEVSTAIPLSTETVSAPTSAPSSPAVTVDPPAAPAPTPAAPSPAASAPVSDSGQDDSGCDTEPEPERSAAAPASMTEPGGPEMEDVEQLARSVVTDTLEKAKQEASLQRQLDAQRKDPDTDEDGWLDIVGNGQLKKKVLTAGSGDRLARPQRSQLATVHLSARTEDGRPAGGLPERLTFGLGDGEVITGLDMAVGLMQPGETAEVYMDARFAYGERGLEEDIAPNTNLTFTVQLESVQPEPKYEEMSAEQRLEIGSQKRDRGNWWFKRDDFNHAIQCYRRALDFFDNESEEFTGLPDDVHVLFEERLKVHNNMAAAQMKLEAFDAALRSVQLVLSCQEDNVKALYRKGKILMAQNQVSAAAETLRLALKHSPENRTVQAELNKVMSVQRKQAEEQKSLYRKMLGLPPSEDQPAPANTAKTFPVKLLVAGVACALAAVAVSRLKLF